MVPLVITGQVDNGAVTRLVARTEKGRPDGPVKTSWNTPSGSRTPLLMAIAAEYFRTNELPLLAAENDPPL